MIAILPVHVLPECLTESDCELRQGHPKTVNSSGTGTVCDVWSRELCEETCESLHPSVGGPEIGWTPHHDRKEIWSVGRSVRDFKLSRTTAGSESRIQRAVGNHLIPENEGLEDTLAPVPPVTEQECHRRGQGGNGSERVQTVMWYAFADRSGCDDAGRSAGTGPWTKGVRHGGVRTNDVTHVPRRTSESIQELSVVR